MRILSVALGFLIFYALVSCCNGAAGGPCDASCTDKLNCCNDQNIGQTCFDTRTDSCVSNLQICALGLALCNRTCYDASLYDCVNDMKLCPVDYQLCGADQCFDTIKYACVIGSNTLRTKAAAECLGLGYNVNINECINGTLGPIRENTPCAPNQEVCGDYCYDPLLYFCNVDKVAELPGFCGQGKVPCASECYDPMKYNCVDNRLVGYQPGDACPSGQEVCGQACYNPATLNCLEGVVICTIGLGSCNNTCYNTSRYDCVNKEILMHDGYCPTGYGLCGLRCYDKTVYTCSRDLLSPIAASGCGSDTCLQGDGCCADAYNGTLCFEQEFYECKPNVDGSKLCGEGLGLCGGLCYDTSIYTCHNNEILCPSSLDYCMENTFTGCYDKSSYTCLSTTKVLCPIGYLQCGDVCINQDKYVCGDDEETELVVCQSNQRVCNGTCYSVNQYTCQNHTLVELDNPCQDGNCNGTCYDRSRFDCVNGALVTKDTCEDEDEDFCVAICYNTTTHVCVDDKVLVMCQTGENRCNETCYDPDIQQCTEQLELVNITCVSRGLQECDSSSVCFNSTAQDCVDGEVLAKCAANEMRCAKTCYDQTKQECYQEELYPICSPSQERCEKVCFDPDVATCVNGVVTDNSSASINILSIPLCIIVTFYHVYSFLNNL